MRAVLRSGSLWLFVRFTGFFESQFYRPSKKDYGQREKLGLEVEDVYFESRDGTRLHGWFMGGVGEVVGTVIHFHGSDSNISYTVKNSHWLTDYGFNVFAFDYRGYGKSGGRASRQGVVEDGVAAISYVRSRADVDVDRVCVWGQSMGGQLAIVAAEMAGASRVRAVVGEATYASYSHHIKDKMGHLGPLWLVQCGAWLVTGDAFSAERVVGRLSPVPVLLVHGTGDGVVQPYHSERLFDAAGDPKDIWRVEGVGHLRVFGADGARRRLVEFLKGAL